MPGRFVTKCSEDGIREFKQRRVIFGRQAYIVRQGHGFFNALPERPGDPGALRRPQVWQGCLKKLAQNHRPRANHAHFLSVGACEPVDSFNCFFEIVQFSYPSCSALPQLQRQAGPAP